MSVTISQECLIDIDTYLPLRWLLVPLLQIPLLLLATYLLDELVDVVYVDLAFVSLHALHQRSEGRTDVSAVFGLVRMCIVGAQEQAARTSV